MRTSFHFTLSLLFVVLAVTIPLVPASANPSLKNHLPRISKALSELVGDDSKAFLGYIPIIELKENPFPSAYAENGNRIVLTTGLLDLAETDEELEFAIAHEIAHLSLKHGSYQSLTGFSAATDDELREELDADRAAWKLTRQSSSSGKAGPSGLLRKIANFGSGKSRLGDHYPSLWRRIQALEEIS